MEITVTGQEINGKEKQAYVDYLEKKYNRRLESLQITLDGEYADLSYQFQPEPFERIRRITGYLTGNLSTWNNGKRAEEADRVKHGLEKGFEIL
ncbi:hypothetical protein FRZ06_11935 [Anoxybacterium hadale]|uniref:Uncharacterized protein n=1 Tax=Anoxybacterium hadale TaxID=3408580 RepID=A0ACD1ABZ7_9FIRM|nr:hypothetical protein FRZ06_11935 [Clostridiales bacterium]